MNDSLPDLFKQAAKPFPKDAYKDVSYGRGFTAIDAYHIVERLTEMFGLCGVGWGFDDLKFSHSEKHACCQGKLWFTLDPKSERCSVPAIGEAMINQGNVAEGYKKAQTNMLSKATSFLGIGLSIYQGKGIDDPYLEKATQPKVERKIVPQDKAQPTTQNLHSKLKKTGKIDWNEFNYKYTGLKRLDDEEKIEQAKVYALKLGAVVNEDTAEIYSNIKLKKLIKYEVILHP